MRKPVRHLPGLVAGALLLSLASACTDDPAPGPPAPADARKGEKVDPEAFVDALESSFDEGRTARVTFDVSGAQRLQGRGVVEYDDEGMNVDVRLSDWQVEGGWIHVRTVAGKTYMKVPESRGLWVDIGGDDEDATGSLMEGADPRSDLDAYRADIDEVRFHGEEPVAGATARHYRVVVGPDDTRTDPGSTGETGTDTGRLVTDYWFDADERVAKRSDQLDGTGTVTFTWTDWGVPAEITPPPRARRISVAELERLRRQQSSR